MLPLLAFALLLASPWPQLALFPLAYSVPSLSASLMLPLLLLRLLLHFAFAFAFSSVTSSVLLFSASLMPPLCFCGCCCTSFSFFYVISSFLVALSLFLDLPPQVHLFPPRVSLQGVFSLLLSHA